MTKQILFSLFLFATTAGYTQEKKDSKVIAHVSDTAGIFNRVVKALLIDGYDLETRDAGAGIISTKEKELPTYAGKAKIRVIIDKNTLTFTSSLRLSFTSDFGDMEGDVSFIGSKRSPMREAWNVMVKEAKQFGEITYAR